MRLTPRLGVDRITYIVAYTILTLGLRSNVSQRRKPQAMNPPKKRLNGSDYKKAKISGGRPALAKKVTAELDSDDELIVKMKHAKYQEKEIAQRLIDEGRTHYHPKTIGTRWARIKKVMQARNDELLDQDLTDWHDGDVCRSTFGVEQC
jgi:hypothetical protein